MLESVGFMFFSTVETFSWFVVSMTLFRFKFKDYSLQALLVILLMNLQSYVLRNELSLSYLVPIISIIIFVFFYSTVVKIPLLGSAILTVSGFAIFAVTQSVLVKVMFGSISEAQATVGNGYALQSATGLILIIGSMIFYKFGLGYTFNFERLRLKFEHIIILVLFALFLIIVTYILYYNEIWINIAFFIITLAILLYYGFRKESEND